MRPHLVVVLDLQVRGVGELVFAGMLQALCLLKTLLFNPYYLKHPVESALAFLQVRGEAEGFTFMMYDWLRMRSARSALSRRTATLSTETAQPGRGDWTLVRGGLFGGDRAARRRLDHHVCWSALRWLHGLLPGDVRGQLRRGGRTFPAS